MESSISLPSPFEDYMRRLLGGEFDLFMKSLTENPPVSVRFNPQKKNSFSTEVGVPWCNSGIYLKERPVFTLDPYFHAGSYYVQEASSMFLEEAIRQTTNLDTPLNVLDLCAAPGGKSTHLLSLISPESVLVSNEVIRSRASVLAENITRWGRSNAVVTSNDPEDFRNYPDTFDVVVVDAPCSGEGLFRKDPSAINEWSPEAVELCVRRQKRILSAAWSSVKGGGVMIYSTCTFNREENENNIRWLLEQVDAEVCPLTIPEAWNISAADGPEGIGYRFFPHRVGGEGLFLSVIRKKRPATDTGTRKQKRSIWSRPSNAVIHALQQWLVDDEQVFLQWQDIIQIFPSRHLEWLDLLSTRLKIVQAGTVAATLRGDKIIPAHGLALSISLDTARVDQLELALPDMLKFLRGESLAISSSEKGYATVTFNGLPLGWVNRLGNRFNNLYPQSSRIKMQV